MREKAATLLALLTGGFIFYTSAVGPFESLIHRAIFLGLVISLGLLLYPLGGGKGWRPLGMAIDLAAAAISIVACAYIIQNYDEIMGSLPWATTWDMVMTAGLVLTVLEIARRAIGILFPALVSLGLLYAIFGDLLPRALSHRGYDLAFVTETLFLGDLGIWGMLVGVAATTIAAFLLFGAMLLHTGSGQTFIDLATRVGGRSPGGAAKIATIASGLFGMVSGSAVASVATTGNFTIPLMKRLRYPPALAGGVEAVASTGGQIAPPILGAAAFVMAETLGVSYVTIAVAAVIPALLYYLAVFMTVHILAVNRNLPVVPEAEMPRWADVLAPRKIAPIVVSLGALGTAIFMGRSVQTAAFYGLCGLLVSFVLVNLGRLSAREMAERLVEGLGASGRGLVIIGILLAGAQILVSMINLTGVGVTLSSLIVTAAGSSLIFVAIIVAGVCLIMGMGIPTTAAYVLVAAVLAPALVEAGIAPLTSHMFVFYFATLSVITPPVCIAVFVAAGIAETHWTHVARESLRLAAVIYVLPFLLLLYPGMLWQGDAWGILEALISGVAFVLAISAFLGGRRVLPSRLADGAIFFVLAGLAIVPHWLGPLASLAGLALFTRLGPRGTGRLESDPVSQ